MADYGYFLGSQLSHNILLSSPASVSCLTRWFYCARFTNEKMKLRKAIGLRAPQRPMC